MEVEHKFHLKNQTDIVGLASMVNMKSQKYDLEDEIAVLRTVHDQKADIHFNRLTYLNDESDFRVIIYLDEGEVKVVYNQEDDNYLVMLLGYEDCFGNVYDYFLDKLLPKDKIYTKIHNRLYSIEHHDDGYLVTEEATEESVGYLKPRRLHLIILESRLEKQEKHYLLHITKGWVKELVPKKEEE